MRLLSQQCGSPVSRTHATARRRDPENASGSCGRPGSRSGRRGVSGRPGGAGPGGRIGLSAKRFSAFSAGDGW
eukprot:8891568-Heterocapsa_arctica.AAC.1